MAQTGKDALAALGGIALIATMFLAGGALLAALFLGVHWISQNVLQHMISAAWVVLALVIFVLLPLSIFRRLRGFTGGAMFISSYLFGLIAWISSFVLTWELWGGWAVVAGIMLFGGMVVPFAILATLFKGLWVPLIAVTVLVVVALATRIGGAAIAERAR